MTDQVDQSKAIGDGEASGNAMTFAEFLESKPPGATVTISDLLTRDARRGTALLVSTPPLHLHCSSPSCSGLRYFRFTDGDRQLEADDKLDTFLTFTCSNCRKAEKRFAVSIFANIDSFPAGKCYKHGEMPPFGPVTPPRLLKLLDSSHRDLFMKGRRCEAQGLGIGAFVYYRRVVEDQREQIIGEILRVAETVGAPQPMVDLLREAKSEKQFSKSLNMIKDAIPESLRIQGHNPLTLLHDNLSNGLHSRSDAECLEVASAVRIVLAELADRIRIALKDEAELTSALSKLLNK